MKYPAHPSAHAELRARAHVQGVPWEVAETNHLSFPNALECTYRETEEWR
jgi:hypothetical protein